MIKIDMLGLTFGRLLVLRESDEVRHNKIRWECKCSCGNITTVCGEHLRSGATQSCGCLRDEKVARLGRTTGKINSQLCIIHGRARTREYNTWSCMKQRCYNPKHTAYLRYGRRGIYVCEEWKDSFETFYIDMGDIPEGKTLDRIDNDGNYSKDNCRWATKKEQANNR